MVFLLAMRCRIDGSARAAAAQVLATGVQKGRCFVNGHCCSVINMQWLWSLSLLALLSLVQALSSSGNRLLVVVEEATDKAKYSTFFGDLEGMSTGFLFLMIHHISHSANDIFYRSGLQAHNRVPQKREARALPAWRAKFRPYPFAPS